MAGYKHLADTPGVFNLGWNLRALRGQDQGRDGEALRRYGVDNRSYPRAIGSQKRRVQTVAPIDLYRFFGGSAPLQVAVKYDLQVAYFKYAGGAACGQCARAHRGRERSRPLCPQPTPLMTSRRRRK